MAAEGHNYAFIEATGRRTGDKASLERLVPVPAGKLRVFQPLRNQILYCQ